jgi:hypothetical protein
MRILSAALVASLLAAPAFAQSNSNRYQEGENAKIRELQSPEVEFLNSSEAYWVTKGYNDMLYYGNGGSVNSVRLERDQFRADQALQGIYKPAQIVEIKVNGKVTNPVVPTLKMGGKEVRLRDKE